MRIVVTGASGKAGKYVVRALVDAGHDVLATDIAPRLPDCPAPFVRADLADYGAAVEVLAGVDAVAHLANIPAPELFTAAHTLNTNNAMNSNVFLAAAQHRLRRVVWASSETTLGLPFDEPPRYAPVDEAHYPVPTSTYALSKVVAEAMAEQVSGWSGIPFVALRLSNVIEPADYALFERYQHDPLLRKWNLWGYIDARDAGQAIRKALDVRTPGYETFIIANADTVMSRSSASLAAEVFPDVPVTKELGEHETMLSIDKARRLLGYEPEFSWRSPSQEV